MIYRDVNNKVILLRSLSKWHLCCFIHVRINIDYFGNERKYFKNKGGDEGQSQDR